MGIFRARGGNQEATLGKQWKAIARSEIGTSHISDRKPCQDYAGYKQYKDYFIGAVSDGAGSRALSQHGSQLAVETTLDYFVDKLENARRGSNPLSSQEDAEALFRELIGVIRDRITQKAEAWPKEAKNTVSPSQFACTLLVFIAFPKGIAAMQLGDGFIVIRDFKDKNYNLLFASTKDGDQPVNYTTFITSAPAEIEKDLQIVYRPNPVSFVCASTDGLESVALDLVNQKAYPGFFITLEKYVQETLEPERDSYISAFLQSERINRKTDDDKTILLCTNPNADPAPEINAITTSQPPAPLPPTSTPPPVVSHYPRNPDPIPPSGKRAPKSSSSQTKTPPGTTSDNNPVAIPPITKVDVKIETRNSPHLVGILLFSNFFCVYFPITIMTYIAPRIIRNPDIGAAIFALVFGSVISVLFFFYAILSGLYAAEGTENKNRSPQLSNKKKSWSLPSIAEVFAFLLPFIALILALATAFTLNNTFPDMPKSSESKPSPTQTPISEPSPSVTATPQPSPKPSTKPQNTPKNNQEAQKKNLITDDLPGVLCDSLQFKHIGFCDSKQ